MASDLPIPGAPLVVPSGANYAEIQEPLRLEAMVLLADGRIFEARMLTIAMNEIGKVAARVPGMGARVLGTPLQP